VLDALKRVARNFDNDEKRLQAVDLQFYALRKDGEYAAASLWGTRSGTGPQFAVCTSDRPSRHENCAFLLERKA
jgi:N4-(beta-N-acetylglucosaminyl)-L-asparaginase